MAEDGVLPPKNDGPALVTRRRQSVAVHVTQDVMELPATQLLSQSSAMDPPTAKLLCGHDVVAHPSILTARGSDQGSGPLTCGQPGREHEERSHDAIDQKRLPARTRKSNARSTRLI